MTKKIVLFGIGLLISVSSSAVDMHALADSLDNFAGFNLGCIPRVKVTQLKTRDNQVFLYTNKTLAGLSLSEKDVAELRLKVSKWVNGTTNAQVTIYSDGFELNELITERFKPRPDEQHYPIPNRKELGCNLQGQHIALWPSHGIYYNRDEDRWKLQRATMWSTVEDLYTTSYAEQVSQMLERAGATVHWPRARYGKDEKATEIGPSGFPRWAEAARYWLEYTDVPDSVWNPISDKANPAKDSIRNDYIDDLRSRGLWVNWLQSKGVPLSLSIALHTDGYSQPGDSQTIGTLAIYSVNDYYKQRTFPSGQSRILNRDLADFVQTQVVEDIRAKYDPNWKRRELQNAGYAEARYTKVPSVLLEILSHKQFADIRYGLQPRFRKDVSRAIYKGIGRWIHAQVGTDFVVQPLEVQKMAISPDLVVTWLPTIDPIEPSATPTYYIVELRENDGAWKIVERTTKTRYILPSKNGVRYDVRVTAGNEGGTSAAGETLSAFIGKKDKPSVLIINAFNRTDGPKWWADSINAGIVQGSYSIPDGNDGIFIGEQWEYNRALDWISDDDCGWGMCYRDQVGTRQVGNTHDYPVLHGRALQELGYTFVSINSEAIDTIDSRWDAVDVIYGKDTITSIPELSRWQGKALISGALLGAIPRSSKIGVVRFKDMNYRYAVQPNDKRICAENATAQIAKNGQCVRARYADSGTPACIQTKNQIIWSVPLESFEDFASIYKQSIKALFE